MVVSLFFFLFPFGFGVGRGRVEGLGFDGMEMDGVTELMRK